jgi:hypothetical protein
MAANQRTTTSRKPRTAARAASRPSRTAPEPEAQDVDEQQPTAAETEAEGLYVTAVLCGEELQIIPPGSWRASWQALLNQGQIAAFVEQVVHPDDIDTFWEIDPVNTEFYDFIEDAAQQSGESLGKSRGPGRSSQRTRRR